MVFSAIGYSLRSQNCVKTKKYDIHFVQITVEKAIQIIEEKTEYKIYYSPQIVDADSVFSLSITESIDVILKELFQMRIDIQVINDNIVVLPQRNILRKLNKPKDNNLKYGLPICGMVYDSDDKKSVNKTGVFELTSKQFINTDNAGGFVLNNSGNIDYTFLYLNKPGYKDTIIAITPDYRDNIHIELHHEKDSVLVYGKAAFRSPLANHIPAFINEFMLRGRIDVSENLLGLNKNRIAQFSVVPFLSTNGKSNGHTSNFVSLNLLGGYNGGVRAFELGGILNLTTHNVFGIQVAGLMNFVNNDLVGAQFSTISNRVFGLVSGLQFSGLFNYSNLGLKGLQLAGGANISRNNIVGSQISSVYNHSCKSVYGLQLSGMMNAAISSLNGVQIGLINYAGQNSGLQLGLINISKKNNGISIGLLNYFNNQEKTISFFTDEIFWSNFSLMTGNDKLYSKVVVAAGMKSSKYIGFGYGLGFNHSFRNALSGAVEYTLYITNTLNHFFNSPVWINRMHYRIAYDFKSQFEIFAGPSMNYSISKIARRKNAEFTKQLISNEFYNSSMNRIQYYLWPGLIFGIQYSF